MTTVSATHNGSFLGNLDSDPCLVKSPLKHIGVTPESDFPPSGKVVWVQRRSVLEVNQPVYGRASTVALLQQRLGRGDVRPPILSPRSVSINISCGVL